MTGRRGKGLGVTSAQRIGPEAGKAEKKVPKKVKDKPNSDAKGVGCAIKKGLGKLVAYKRMERPKGKFTAPHDNGKTNMRCDGEAKKGGFPGERGGKNALVRQHEDNHHPNICGCGDAVEKGHEKLKEKTAGKVQRSADDGRRKVAGQCSEYHA